MALSQVNDAQIDDWKFSLLITALGCVNLIALFHVLFMRTTPTLCDLVTQFILHSL
jgi:hypothetical protein